MDETPAYRLGDADREQVVNQLKTAWSDGRLTMDEFSERSGRAYAARSRHDLDVLVADLPPTAGPASYPPARGYRPVPAPAPAPATGPAGGGPVPGSGAYPAASGERGPVSRRFVAIMSGRRAKGRWTVPAEVSAFAFWGHVSIDLRTAEITTPVVTIRATALMGGVDVIVPPGMRVDLDGFVLMGGATDLTRSSPPAGGGPLVHVKAGGLWGGVTIRTLKPGKRASDPAEVAQAWQQAEADDEAADAPQDEDDWPWGHRPHGHGHRASRRGGPRFPGPPVPPGLPRGLQDILPQMPGRPVPASRRRRSAEAAEPTAPATRATPAQAPAAPPEPAPAAPAPAAPPASSTAPLASAGPPAPGPAASEASSTAGAPTGSGVRPTGQVLTMLVSDIVDSTQSAVAVGDQRWMGILATHDALFREQVRRHHGNEVKHQGDGFLVTFTSARQAVLAGIAIQRAMASHRRAFPDNDLHLRLGIHTGEVVEDNGDIFGANVITAVRIADAAEPDEVLVSGLTRDLTEAAGDLAFDEGRETTLKGMARPARVFAADWT